MNLGCIIEGELRLKPKLPDNMLVIDVITSFENGFKPKIIVEDLKND